MTEFTFGQIKRIEDAAYDLATHATEAREINDPNFEVRTALTQFLVAMADQWVSFDSEEPFVGAEGTVEAFFTEQ